MASTRKRRNTPSVRWEVWWALGMALLVGLLHLTTSVFDALERRLFDWASTHTDRPASTQVVVVAIDDASIQQLGRWPWPRDVHARALDVLASAQAKTVVLTPFFFEPHAEQALAWVAEMHQALDAVDSADPAVGRLRELVEGARLKWDTDGQLAASLARAGHVFLAAHASATLGPVPARVPPLPTRAVAWDAGVLAPLSFPTADELLWPVALLADRAAGVAHLTQVPDAVDGVLRTGAWFYQHGSQVLPGLAVLAAAHALDTDPRGVAREGDGHVVLGPLRIPVGAEGRVLPQYYPSGRQASAFATVSFHDVYAGRVSAGQFAGKVVIIGATAAGLGDRLTTPVNVATSAADVMAHEVSSLLSNHFFEQPAWAWSVQWAAFAAVTALLAWGLPRLGGVAAAAVGVGGCMALLVVGVVMVTLAHTWVPLVMPAALLALGSVVMITRRSEKAEADQRKAHEESAETSRLMALALQGQGQLDMAFDRFRRVPLNDAVMDNLMHLALDFERKRQFHKALAVCQHMASHDPHFKGLAQRMAQLKALSESLVLPGAAGGSSTVVLSDAVAQPTLGRYQLEKELGKGAMGVVYQGKDPKIGRVVAIKTMALAKEFDGTELDEARQRFFREAETAGRLQHPHIVTIFDAGEEQDLAYIAMEFLKGQDLTPFTRPGKLLPVAQVVSIVARVADALDYAHALHVVHRDIKPANVMFDPVTDTVKVTDFGIARVTDASRTRTGMVLGTPSFMSPEQIAGQKVDGRSDLYSLGVMAFQLLTGSLPFRADSMAELMYQIAHQPAPRLSSLRPDLPGALEEAVARALHKDLAVRFARGRDMAQAFRACLAGGSMVGTGSESWPNVPPEPTEQGFAATVVMPRGPENSP